VCRPHTRQLVHVTDQPSKRLPQVLAVVLIEKFKDLEVPPATRTNKLQNMVDRIRPAAIALTVRSFPHQRFAGCQIGGSPHPRENPPQAFRQPMQVSAIQTAQRIDEQPGMGAGRS
jgi:hypothetical protein